MQTRYDIGDEVFFFSEIHCEIRKCKIISVGVDNYSTFYRIGSSILSDRWVSETLDGLLKKLKDNYLEDNTTT